MKNLDLSYLCRTVGNLCGFPVRLYEGRSEICHVDHSGLAYDPAKPYLVDMFAIPGHIGTYITPVFHYYGLVRSGPFCVMCLPGMWPVFFNPCEA